MAATKKEWTISDILLGESDAHSRRSIPQNTGREQVGCNWLWYPSNKNQQQRLLALSKPVGGKVLVQPRNCTISLRAFATLKDIFNKYRVATGKPPASFKDEMIAEGLEHGIKYVDFPDK